MLFKGFMTGSIINSPRMWTHSCFDEDSNEGILLVIKEKDI